MNPLPSIAKSAVVLALLAAPGQARETPVVQAARTSAPPRIDGRLDDLVWHQAPTMADFFQREPVEGAQPTEQTQVRILFDDDHLYFALRCFDSQADRLVANQMRRDADLNENDNIQIILDPYNDRRGGFYFSTNPLGARQDLLLADEGRTRNQAWDSVWQSRTSIDSLGWSAEVAIPFDQVRYPDSDQAVWGINIGRAIRRKNEEVFLVPPPQSYGLRGRYRTSRLAVLTGLGQLQSRPPLAVVPFLLSGTRRDFTADGSTEYDLDPGLDFKYGLTPSLTLDLSYRTDFAQVEADQEQINLTRFSLFFPEKRDFFLEGAGIFALGERVERQDLGGRPPTLLFYSRRIGIEEEHNLPVLAGGKLTGRAGPYQIGALRMTTQAMTFVDEEEEDRFVTADGNLLDEDQVETSGQAIVDTLRLNLLDTLRVAQTDFTVLRLKRDMLGRSNLGFIAIDKQPGSGADYNRTAGVDFTLWKWETGSGRATASATNFWTRLLQYATIRKSPRARTNLAATSSISSPIRAAASRVALRTNTAISSTAPATAFPPRPSGATMPAWSWRAATSSTTSACPTAPSTPTCSGTASSIPSLPICSCAASCSGTAPRSWWAAISCSTTAICPVAICSLCTIRSGIRREVCNRPAARCNSNYLTIGSAEEAQYGWTAAGV